MRVVSWNCRRAKATARLWGYFRELAPDIAFLQEVGTLPADVASQYSTRVELPRTRGGNAQRFRSAILARGALGEPVSLRTPHEWANGELERLSGNVMASRIGLTSGPSLVGVGVYSPAWPVARTLYAGQRVAGIKLELNPDIWVADLLLAGLRNLAESLDDWMICGDFNACETFDSWRGGPRGNREWLDRMAGLGLTECLRTHQGQLTPTFRKPGRGVPSCQLDYIFVGETLARRLTNCSTGDSERVLKDGLSDHLPVIADFADDQAGSN